MYLFQTPELAYKVRIGLLNNIGIYLDTHLTWNVTSKESAQKYLVQSLQ